MHKIMRLVSETKNEIDKVIFPTTPHIKEAFFNVFLMVTVISLFLTLIDVTISLNLIKIL
jgi:preprotein translocase subunit SecE